MTTRPNLLWYGQAPSLETETACADRGVTLSRREAPPSVAEFSSARGIVFSLPATLDATAFASAYADTLRTALWHGLRVFILVDLANTASIAGFLKSLPYGREPRLWAHGLERDV